MKLPEDPIKRRRAVFKNIYRQYEVWEALIEKEGPEKSVLEVDGEDIHFYDLMAGIETLPPRQREAFQLNVLEGLSEWQAAKIMLPGTRWSTPVQQYSKSALIRMIAAYDRVQTKEGRAEQILLNEKATKKKARAKRRAEAKKYEVRPKEETSDFTRNVRKSLFD